MAIDKYKDKSLKVYYDYMCDIIESHKKNQGSEK